jgi:Na+-driven multidrug efflux pump
MNHSARSIAKSLLRGAGWLCFAIAVLAFLFGGEVISAFTGTTDRIFAALEGFALALPFAGLGFLAKMAEDRLEEGKSDGPSSLGDALRK